ncbi:hypothetical protein [Dysgonomonas sp. 520]|uniref:hypothetical protein n=1 Tax=Dysgonomonas sp. 520 TaxID=2302931 RepID=UPI0013D08360|nr:hypothetical protein [Dysgonomonas sp. 520]NDW10595.1 hypothetical protein [Dysgonomonas sp. 520]
MLNKQTHQNTTQNIDTNNLVSKYFHWFWWGLLFYSAITIASTFFKIDSFTENSVKLVGTLIMFYSSFHAIRIKFEDKTFKVLFWLYIIWQLVVVARGFAFDYEIFILMYVDDGYFFYVVIPFIIFMFADNLANYKYLIDFLFKLGYIFLFLITLTIFDILSVRGHNFFDNMVVTLSIPVGFLILSYFYLDDKQKKIAALIFIVSILASFIYARRNLAFSFAGFLGLAIFLHFIYYSQKTDKKLIFVILLALVAGFGFLVYDMAKETMFSGFEKRLTVNTREEVTIMYFQDMEPQDWVIGKGMNGTYYAPGIDGDNSEYRHSIETGFLTVILKGGIVSLALFWSICFYAIYAGYFKTKNGFTKGAALLVFFWLLEMYPSGQLALNIRYIMVWVCIGICVSPKLRAISDSELKNYFCDGKKVKIG